MAICFLAYQGAELVVQNIPQFFLEGFRADTLGTFRYARSICFRLVAED